MRTLLHAAVALAAALAPHAGALLRHLVQAAVMGTLFVLAVWVVCRLAPRLPAGLRCALWWLASLKLVLGLVWPAPLAVPLLPPASGRSAAAGLARWLAPEQAAGRPAQTARPRSIAAAHGLAGGTVSARGAVPAGRPPLPNATVHIAAAEVNMSPSGSAGRPASGSDRRPVSGLDRRPATPPRAIGASAAVPWWPLALAAIWVAGLLRQVGLMARELRRVRRFLRGSAPVRDESVLRLAAELGRVLELPAVELRAAPGAAELAAPLTAGALRPVVVLPASGLERLSRQELAMTLGHELMHVRRRDLLWGWLPAAAERLFFFLPPAALAAREYALAREAACDAAVLRLLGAAPASYGRLLVRLGARGPAAWKQAGLDLSPASVATAGAASSLHQLKRRLEMLQHHSPQISTRPATLRRLGFCLLALLAAAALLPLRIVAAVPSQGITPAIASGPAGAEHASIATAAVATTSTIFTSASSPTVVASAAVKVSAIAATAAGPATTVPVIAPAAIGSPILAAPGAVLLAAPGVPLLAAPGEPLLVSPGIPLLAAPGIPILASAGVTDTAITPAATSASARLITADSLRRQEPAPATRETASAESSGQARVMAAPEPPEPPEAPEPPKPPMDHGPHHVSGHLHMRSDGRTHGDVYVLLHGRNDLMVSGSSADVDRARELRRKAGDDDVLWTRRNGKEYLVRDAATLQAVRDLFRPQEELGDQQGKLGDQQGKLGDQQGELGDRQGELGSRQGKLGAEEAKLAAEETRLAAEEAGGGEHASEAREKRRAELREAQRKLSREMRELGERQRELGDKQRDLGKQQRELGRRQSALGREQERAARAAEAKLHALLDRAIANGTAQEVK